MDTLLRYEKLLNHLHATNNRKHLRIQLGHMVNHVDAKRLDDDNAYKKLYNRIRLKYANMNTRFNTLTRIEKLINNGKPESAYRKLHAHTNWTLARNNPDYRALYNRVTNKLVAKGYTAAHRVHATRPISIKSRQQQGGTCWFHGIINGLLMSPRPRQVLRDMVAQMSLSPAVVSTKACPARTASATWFWKYIRHRLSSGGVVSSVFKNKNVIRSIGLRQKTVRPSGLVPRFSNTVSTWRGRIMSSRSGGSGCWCVSLDLSWHA